MVSLVPFQAGIEAARNERVQICEDPRSAFINILTSQGFKMPSALQVDKLDRVDGAEDAQGKRSGWYIYNEIEDSHNEGAIIGIASFGDWKLDISEVWVSRSEHKMSASEREDYHQQREIMREKKEDELKKRQVDAAAIAFKIWQEAEDATMHPYLTKKEVGATQGVKIAGNLSKYDMDYHSGKLIIPVAVNNEITSLQFIDASGGKCFLSGGKLKGGWFVIEGEKDVIYITEGYSTGQSVHIATGKTVYIGFNAGNLYEVSSFVKNSHPSSSIILAGDDDFENEKNVGRSKAEQTADGLGLGVIFPTGFNDFNDMHVEKGIDTVKSLLSPKKVDTYKKKEKAKAGDLERPNGVMGDIIDYYNVTSGNKQDGFAIQTALACCSLILGRLFKTNYNNYPSLYLLNVGKTATGKEHAKSVFEKIMDSTKNGHFLAGDGYTSAGAVMSTLLDRPKHGICTDELGRYLEASMNASGGNSNQREANTMLMEAYGRCEGVVRAKNYSSMTAKKSDADALKNRIIYNPAITWIGMTTPSTFFNTIDINSVMDGFVNRFIISISDAEPDIRRHKEPVDVPQVINDWAAIVMKRGTSDYISSEESKEQVVTISEEADKAQIEFQVELLKIRKGLEKYQMDGLVGRANEQAMRISLIHALSENPHTKTIEKSSMDWGINYMRISLLKTIEMLKITISNSGYEGDKKKILADLRERGEEGITWAIMQKTPPYSQFKQRDLKEILQALKDANLASDELATSSKGGRPTLKWTAI